MPRSKGIQKHSLYKLGKAPAKRDKRNLLFSAVLKKKKVAVPQEYDFDVKHPVPTPMFANDRKGDCVIAGRAHQTLRFELLEQNKVVSITDAEVLKEYFKETGGPDSGLNVLDSLREWRSDGWMVGSRTYKIQAFSEVNRGVPGQVKQAVFMDVGVGLGLSLPISAQAQFAAGKPWDVVSGPDGAAGSWGGHYVLVPGYTTAGPVCVTWGSKHQMTWRFFAKYCDEAYAIFDAKDTAKTRRAIDRQKIKAFLAALGKNKRAALRRG